MHTNVIWSSKCISLNLSLDDSTWKQTCKKVQAAVGVKNFIFDVYQKSRSFKTVYACVQEQSLFLQGRGLKAPRPVGDWVKVTVKVKVTMKKFRNKTWSLVSNSRLSKTSALGSLESLDFKSPVVSLQRSF